MGPTLDVLLVANWWSQAIVHALAYVTFALSLVHGLMAGSDTGSPLALAFYATLRWEDLEFDGPRPTITIQPSADTRKQTRVSTTKTGEERRVRIGPCMVEVLRRHRARQLEERMKASSWEDPGLVFPNTKGKIRRRDSAVRSFKRYLQAAGIPTDVRFHDLRHTAGTLALRQGMPLHAVSKMLGHSDAAMTLRRYAHVLEDMEDEGGRAMDNLF
jgi:integrase